jgi:hypothetical protein
LKSWKKLKSGKEVDFEGDEYLHAKRNFINRQITIEEEKMPLRLKKS